MEIMKMDLRRKLEFLFKKILDLFEEKLNLGPKSGLTAYDEQAEKITLPGLTIELKKNWKFHDYENQYYCDRTVTVRVRGRTVFVASEEEKFGIIKYFPGQWQKRILTMATQ